MSPYITNELKRIFKRSIISNKLKLFQERSEPQRPRCSYISAAKARRARSRDEGREKERERESERRAAELDGDDACDENPVDVGGRVAGVRGQGPRGGLERDQPPARAAHRERGFARDRGPSSPSPSNRARQTHETGREREPNSPNGRQISIPGRGYGELDVPRSRFSGRARGEGRDRSCLARPWRRSARQRDTRVADNGERGREERRKR